MSELNTGIGPTTAAEEVKFLLAWFGQRGIVPGKNTTDQLSVNYFDAGLVDSLGVIELISAIEDHFDIRFDERHFQDRRFSTIGGLSEIVLGIRNKAD